MEYKEHETREDESFGLLQKEIVKIDGIQKEIVKIDGTINMLRLENKGERIIIRWMFGIVVAFNIGTIITVIGTVLSLYFMG